MWSYEETELLGKTSCNLAWWRHQMETFSALLVICAGNSSVTGEVPSQMPVTRSFDVSLQRLVSCVWPHNSFELRASFLRTYARYVNMQFYRPISQIPQCNCLISIQHKTVKISALNGVLWDLRQVHCGIRKNGLLCCYSLLIWSTARASFINRHLLRQHGTWVMDGYILHSQ